MRVSEEEGLLEKEKAEQIIADTPLFDGVERISVELGNDNDGDPAMWLIFHLQKDLNDDDRWHTDFSEYKGQLAMRIIHSGIQRFPYSRLRKAA
jgi:hypothetical protein